MKDTWLVLLCWVRNITEGTTKDDHRYGAITHEQRHFTGLGPIPRGQAGC